MIYFILNATRNAVKVGRSNDPAKRLRSLQTASPDELTMIGVIPGSASEESQLHHRFEEFRIRDRGEWFHGDPELFDAIESLLATGSLHRNVWEECLAREHCRAGLNGLAMLHVPTGRQFDCQGTTWGSGRTLYVFPQPESPTPAFDAGGLFVRASDVARVMSASPLKFRADECVLESEWPITCCRPLARVYS